MWQIRLELDNDYIVLEEDKNPENIEYLLEWYKNHQKYFNGDFAIRFEERLERYE